MQPDIELLGGDPLAFARQLADDAYFDARLSPLLQDGDHLRIADFRIVDQQLFPRALKKRPETLARVHRADDEPIASRLVRMTLHVGFEEPDSFAYQIAISRNQSKAAATID